MAVIGDIVAYLRMDNRDFSRKSRQSRRDSKQLGGQLGGLSKAALKLGLAFAAFKTLKFMKSAGEDAADFARELQGAVAIQNVTIQQQKQMRALALQLSSDPNINKTAEQIAGGYFFLASAGKNIEEQLASLPVVSKFATAGNFDLALATDLATDAQSALGMAAGSAEENLIGLQRTTDVLVKANTIANASVQQFSESLTNKAGAAAKSTKKDIEEIVAVLAAFADQGVKGAEAGTQVAIVLRDLQSKALENKAAFEANGIAVFNAAGEMNNMADIIGDIDKRLAGLSTAASKKLLLDLGFSDKSVGALQALAGTSAAIRNYEAQLKQAGGTSDRVASKMTTDYDKATKRISSGWDRIKLSIGEGMNDFLEPGLRDIGAATEWVAETLEGTETKVNKLSKSMQLYMSVSEDMIARSKELNPEFNQAKQESKQVSATEFERRQGITKTPRQLAVDAQRKELAAKAARDAAAAAAKAKADRELIPRPTFEFKIYDEIGNTLAEQSRQAQENTAKMGGLNAAFSDGAISAGQYRTQMSALLVTQDELTGGANALAESLQRQIALVGLTEQQKTRAELSESGARLQDVERVKSLQSELATREAIARQQERLIAITGGNNAGEVAKLRLIGATEEQLKRVSDMHANIAQAEASRDDSELAKQIRDMTRLPVEDFASKIKKLNELRVKFPKLIDDDTYTRRLAQIQDEWKQVNAQVVRHSALLNSAATVASGDAFSRVIDFLARSKAAATPIIPASQAIVPPVTPIVPATQAIVPPVTPIVPATQAIVPPVTPIVPAAQPVLTDPTFRLLDGPRTARSPSSLKRDFVSPSPSAVSQGVGGDGAALMESREQLAESKKQTETLSRIDRHMARSVLIQEKQARVAERSANDVDLVEA